MSPSTLAILSAAIALTLTGCDPKEPQNTEAVTATTDTANASIPVDLMSHPTLERRVTDLEALIHTQTATYSRLEGAQAQSDELLGSIQAAITELNAELESFAKKQAQLDLLSSSLRTQFEQLRQQSIARKSPPPSQITSPRISAPTPRPVRQTTPSFQVMGIELRGGQTFVAVAPRGASQLRDIRLLEKGDGYDGWTVSRVGLTYAEFTGHGRSVQLDVR